MFRLKIFAFYILCAALLQSILAENLDYFYDDYTYIDEIKMNPNNFVNQTATTMAEMDTVRLPKLGIVRGRFRYKIIANRPIHGFFGLKYGNVGNGLARFQKASYPHPNSGIIDATGAESIDCPSFPDLQRIDENERRGVNVDDCLTLSVFTPNIAASLPVMVYVHGEMLFDGSSAEAKPDYILQKDVILVSVNYRLAPFGFISTQSTEIPGNAALFDIQMALEWVHENIGAFGGNPNQVTLFGQAGGAAIIHALALSGKAEGLFQNLILQSGTALSPYFIDEDPVASARNLARAAMCPGSGSMLQTATTIANCFDRLRTSEILRAFKFYFQENEPRGLKYCGGFKLAIGDKFGFLPKHPAALVNAFHYPVIAGVAKDAGAFIMSRFYNQLSQIRTRNITEFINVVLMHTSQPRHFAAWKNLALEHIFSPNEIGNPILKNIAQGLLELTNLILYRTPIIESIRNSSKTYPTFLYSFDYRGQFHRYGHLDSPLPFPVDATLSDENIYLFPYPVEVSNLNYDDTFVSQQMVSMWTNFAQFNSPQNISSGLPLWPRVSNEYGPFVRISKNIELDYHFGEGVSIPNLYPEFRLSPANRTISSVKQPSSKQIQMTHATWTSGF